MIRGFLRAGKRAEELSETRLDAVRIGQKTGVERFDEIDVRAGENESDRVDMADSFIRR